MRYICSTFFVRFFFFLVKLSFCHADRSIPSRRHRIYFLVPSRQGSVEYAQLNHDADHHSDHGYHGDHSTQDDHIDEIDSSVDNNTVTMGDENMTQSQTVD